MADIKSMTLTQAKTYLSKLKAEGKTESTSKEAGKVADYIKTLQPDKYGSETVKSAYTKLSSGVTKAGGWTEANAENIYQYTGKYPSFTTNADGTPYTGKYGAGGDLTTSLNNFQDTVYQNASSPQLRESISAQLEPDGMEQPEPINRVETLQTMREEMGVADLEQQLNDLKFQLEEQYAQRRLRTQDAEGKPVSLGVIGGRVTEIERQENERIDAIGRQIGYISDQLNTSYNTIQTMINYMGLDYQDAVAAYNTEYNRNLQLYKLVDEEMDEQLANARANLQVYANAITSGNMTYSQLSNTEKTMISKLEVQSGLPIGFIKSLNMSFKDRLLGTSSDGTQAWIIGEDGKLQTISTGLPSSKTSGGAGSYSSAFASARAELDSGKSWGAVWDRMKQQFPELSNQQIDTWLNKSDYVTVDEQGNEQWKRISPASSFTAAEKEEISYAKQLAVQYGASNDDLQKIETDPNFRAWVLAGGYE